MSIKKNISIDFATTIFSNKISYKTRMKKMIKILKWFLRVYKTHKKNKKITK